MSHASLGPRQLDRLHHGTGDPATQLSDCGWGVPIPCVSSAVRLLSVCDGIGRGCCCVHADVVAPVAVAPSAFLSSPAIDPIKSCLLSPACSRLRALVSAATEVEKLVCNLSAELPGAGAVHPSTCNPHTTRSAPCWARWTDPCSAVPMPWPGCTACTKYVLRTRTSIDRLRQTATATTAGIAGSPAGAYVASENKAALITMKPLCHLRRR